MSKRKRRKSHWDKMQEERIAEIVRSVPGWHKRAIEHDIAAKRGRIKGSTPERKGKRVSNVVSGGLPSLGKR